MDPISIKMTDGRGHSLFTTTSVKAGDLLLCEKAIAYLRRGAGNLRDEADLVLMVIQKLWQNSSLETQIDHLDFKTGKPIIQKLPDRSIIVDL